MPSLSDLYNQPLIQKASQSGLLEQPTVKRYIVDNVLQDCTLSSVLLKTGSGAGVVTILRNGFAIPGLTEVAAAVTPATFTSTFTTSLFPGDLVELSYVSGNATDLFFNIKYADLVVGAA